MGDGDGAVAVGSAPWPESGLLRRTGDAERFPTLVQGVLARVVGGGGLQPDNDVHRAILATGAGVAEGEISDVAAETNFLKARRVRFGGKTGSILKSGVFLTTPAATPRHLIPDEKNHYVAYPSLPSRP